MIETYVQIAGWSYCLGILSCWVYVGRQLRALSELIRRLETRLIPEGDDE